MYKMSLQTIKNSKLWII